jgi:hypothetical protein
MQEISVMCLNFFILCHLSLLRRFPPLNANSEIALIENTGYSFEFEIRFGAHEIHVNTFQLGIDTTCVMRAPMSCSWGTKSVPPYICYVYIFFIRD